MRFDPAKRERVLVLVELDRSLTEAAASAGVSRQAVHEWLARGRARPDGEAGEFAARFDAARAAQVSEDDPGDLALQELEASDAADPFSALPGDCFGAAMRQRRGEPLLAGDAEALRGDRYRPRRSKRKKTTC